MNAIILLLIPGAVLIAIAAFDAEIPSLVVAIGWFVWTVSLMSNWGYF